MRIALMTNNYKPFIGGVPISVERLAKGLKQLGHQVTVFAPTYKEQEEESDCFRYSSFMQKFIGGIVLPNPFDRRIEQEFKKNHYDIIHVHHPMLIGRTALYLSQKYHIPLAFTYHTRYEQYLCYAKGIRLLEQGAAGNGRFSGVNKKIMYGIQEKLVPAYTNTFLKKCHHVFAPTQGMQNYLTEVYGADCQKVSILPTGIEERNFLVTEEEKHRIYEKYEIEEDTPLFLSVSRMAHEKNVDFLLDSVSAFKEKWKKPFKLLLVGDGPSRKEYEEKCRELGMEKEVIFVGKVPNEETASYYGAADAFLFASKTETQGIVILEALAGGTPVIALDATGVSDIVRDGECGYLCTENTEMFSDKIIDFLTKDGKKDEFTYNSIQRASEFREEAVALKAFAYYNSIIAKYHHSEEKEGKEISQTVIMG